MNPNLERIRTLIEYEVDGKCPPNSGVTVAIDKRFVENVYDDKEGGVTVRMEVENTPEFMVKNHGFGAGKYLSCCVIAIKNVLGYTTPFEIVSAVLTGVSIGETSESSSTITLTFRIRCFNDLGDFPGYEED